MKVNIDNLNYIAAFLSLRCNLKCSYCINNSVGMRKCPTEVTGEQWVSFLNKLSNYKKIPISLQGGEPTLHKDFYYIVNNLENPVDLLTNLQVNIEDFLAQTLPVLFERDLPYPSIRVSLHPSAMNLSETYEKIKILHEHGYSIGAFIVEHSDHLNIIQEYRKKAKKDGIFFKTKEFLGREGNKIFGTFKYHDAYGQQAIASCTCKTSELLCAPDGLIYRCHHDLYNRCSPIGNIFDNKKIENKYIACENYGLCNPCDIKIKNNRFQVFGHSSVSIKDICYYNRV